jgi:hypothetical protein
MSLIFFGTDDDIRQIWLWLFETPGMRLFEQSSRPDQSNRWFDTWTDAVNYLNDGGYSLAAWFEPAGGMPKTRQVSFIAKLSTRLGGEGRSLLHSPATIRIGRNNDQNGCLASGSISCWTENGARRGYAFWDADCELIDWRKLQKEVSRIQRMIVKQSPAKLRSYPVLPDAFARYKSGTQNLWNWGSECSYPSDLVKEK